MITHLKIQSKLIMKVGTVLAMQAKSKRGKQIIKTQGKLFLVEALNESIGRYKKHAISILIIIFETYYPLVFLRV